MRALHTEQVHAKAARAVHDNSSVLNAHACPAGHMADLKSAVNGTATDGRVVPGDLALSSEATPRSKRAPEVRKVNLNDVVFTHSASQRVTQSASAASAGSSASGAFLWWRCRGGAVVVGGSAV